MNAGSVPKVQNVDQNISRKFPPTKYLIDID